MTSPGANAEIVEVSSSAAPVGHLAAHAPQMPRHSDTNVSEVQTACAGLDDQCQVSPWGHLWHIRPPKGLWEASMRRADLKITVRSWSSTPGLEMSSFGLVKPRVYC